MSKSETGLLWDFIRDVPVYLTGVRVFRRQVLGGVRVGKSEARLQVGIPGQADAYALFPGGGHVEIETKAIGGRFSPLQEGWALYCRTFEIPYIALRPARGETDAETVRRWVRELAQASAFIRAPRDAPAGP